MKTRRLTALLLALCLLATLLPHRTFAAETASGTCGENLTWVLTEDGTLTISGEGAMDDFAYQGAPWYRYRDSIIHVVLEEGVTNLGDYAFYPAYNLIDVALPESLERIGIVALAATSLSYIYIPSGVTEIGPEAFEGNSGLSYFSVSEDNPAFSSDENGVLFDKDKTQLIRCPQAFEGVYVIPDTVEFVGEKAFDHCGSLTEVVIPGSVKELGRHAFFACTALKSVRLSKGLEVIGNEVFNLCSALEGCLTIPSTVTQIGYSPFDFTALTEIRFLGDMPEISEHAFSGAALTVYYPGDNETWTAEKIELCKGISTWIPGTAADVAVSGTWGDNITWMLTYDGTLTVSGEGEAAEESSGNPYPWREYAELIRRVVFEEGVTNVPAYAFEFYYPDLAAVELKSVEILDYAAFRYCSALTSVTLPDTLKEIRNGALSNTALTEVDIPVGVTLIGSNAFYRTNLTEIVLPEGLLTLYDGVFWECKQLKYAYLPDSITSIGMHLFYGCTALETANIPKNLPYVPDMMFGGCSSLKSIEIPDGVTMIAMANFRGTGLTSVTIPASVTYMGSAFMECTDLKEIIFQGDAPNISDICFEGVTATAYYPAGNATWTDDVMLNYGGTITWEANQPEARIVSTSASLGGNIAMNFYVEMSEELAKDPDAYMQFTVGTDVIKVPLSQGAKSVEGGVTMYRYSCALNAKRMTDTVTGQVMNANGPVGKAYSGSIMSYGKYLLDNTSNTKLHALVKAMLNYGAACQLQFNYRTDDLANAVIPEADKVLADADVSDYAFSCTGKESGVASVSCTLRVDSETVIRIYFELAEGANADDYTFKVDGRSVKPTAYGGNYYYIQQPNVGAHNLNRMYTFSCGNVTLTYGAMSYVEQVLNNSAAPETLVNVAKALYAYSQAAQAYIK